MKQMSPKNRSDIRKRHNEDLIRRMHNGEALCTFDSKDSWFPPRPIVKKDKKEVERLYGKGSGERQSGESGRRAQDDPASAGPENVTVVNFGNGRNGSLGEAG